MKLLDRILGRGGSAAGEFAALSRGEKAEVERRLAQPARAAPATELVPVLDRGRGAFAAEYERVLEEVKRRCPDAEIWQNFYLDLLDEEGEIHDEGEGVGADPVGEDEELRRLLAGVTLFPQVRSRFAWELGYHTVRFALATGDPAVVQPAARAAVEDFLLAFDAATDPEGRVNALGDLAGALWICGDERLARNVCDYAASLSPEEATRQELHRLRREGLPFVYESYGARRRTSA